MALAPFDLHEQEKNLNSIFYNWRNTFLFLHNSQIVRFYLSLQKKFHFRLDTNVENLRPNDSTF